MGPGDKDESQAAADPVCLPQRQFARLADGRVLWRAPAKLNLSLAILGRRSDGYHELDSLVAKVSLYDGLVFAPRSDGRIELDCRGADCGPAEKNLAYRAAALLPRRQGQGATIELAKSIRPGAGLGGGSSDAATTLLALNELWGLGLPRAELANLAARLGADVPLFLAGPAARMQGVGERLTPVDLQPFWAILCMSELACPTKEVYAAYDRPESACAGLSPRTGRRTHAGDACTPYVCSPYAPAGPPSAWGERLFDDLTDAALAVCPALADLAGEFSAATGQAVHMTGSGSGLFVLFDDLDGAIRVYHQLPALLSRHCRIVTLNPW